MFTFRNARIVALAIAWLSTPSFVYGALLEGEEVFARLEHQDTSSSMVVGDESGIVTVGPGLEVDDLGARINPDFQQNSIIVDIDFSDVQIVITAVNEQPVAHREFIRISVLGADPPRVRYSLNPATNWAGFVPGAFQPFAPQQFDVILTESSALPGQQIVIDVVPEPAAAALLAVACPALLITHRRRRLGHAY